MSEFDVPKISILEISSPKDILIKTVSGNVHIPLKLFSQFTNIIKKDNPIISHRKTHILIDILCYHMITVKAVQKLHEYMIILHASEPQENNLPEAPLISTNINRIFKNKVDVDFFCEMISDIRLLSELIALVYLLECDIIRQKATATFAAHSKKEMNIKEGTFNNFSIELLSKILSPSNS